MEGADFTDADMRSALLGGAWLDRTRLWRGQLAGGVGEEILGRHDKARQIYSALKQNFDGLGDYDGASWAYVRERRMERAMHAPWRAWRYFSGARPHADARKSPTLDTKSPNALGFLGLPAFFGVHTLAWLADWLVDAVCGFGESISQVLLTLVLLFALFVIGYGLTGGVLRECAGAGCDPVATTQLGDLALFSLGAMTTMEPEGLKPANDLVQIAARLEALFAIALTGLLGFVLGNRIRRS